MVHHDLANPYFHFPERAALIGRLMEMASGRQAPTALLVPAETGGGKSRLVKFLEEEAGLPARAAVGISMRHFGPESIANDLLEVIGAGPTKETDFGFGQTMKTRVSLPLEQAMDLLESALPTVGTKLLLIDNAHYICRQQSVAGRRWAQGFLRSLVQRHRISVVMLTIPEYEQPGLPGLKVERAFLGTVGDSAELRTWLDSIQDAHGAPEVTGRLTDPEVLPVLIAVNHGMLGFIEDDAFSLIRINPEETFGEEEIVTDLHQRVFLPQCHRQYMGPEDFRKRVFQNLRGAYDHEA